MEAGSDNNQIVIDVLSKVPNEILQEIFGTDEVDQIGEKIKSVDESMVTQWVEIINRIGLEESAGGIWEDREVPEGEEPSPLQQMHLNSIELLKEIASKL